jgi:TonB family protein
MQYFRRLWWHKTYFLSLYLHLVLLILIVTPYKSTSSSNKTFTDNKIIAYTYINIANIEAPKQQKKISSIKKIISLRKTEANKINKVDKVDKMNVSTSKQDLSLPDKKNDDQKRKEELLSLLHQAIAKKQSYPQEALMLNEKGTARVRFLLYLDGHIEELSLLKSSGFATLDSSALTTVKEIAPITEAKTHLRQKTFFSVDVIFE